MKALVPLVIYLQYEIALLLTIHLINDQSCERQSSVRNSVLYSLCGAVFKMAGTGAGDQIETCASTVSNLHSLTPGPPSSGDL